MELLFYIVCALTALFFVFAKITEGNLLVVMLFRCIGIFQLFYAAIQIFKYFNVL